MSDGEALDRLRAWGEGRPVAITETMPFPRARDADRLIVAFVRMGGESSPWGVAIGRPDASPRFFTTPEPRNADLHAGLVLAFADELLAHVGHPLHLPSDARASERPFPEDLLRLRQLWMPGPTHVEMLHFLDYRYTLAMTGEAARLRSLRAFGRACGWLFRESTRPGQVRVCDATARLREVFAFPAESLRQKHLGFLLGWMGDGDRDARAKRAADAEHEPVGVTMLPAYEREALVGLVTGYNRAEGDAEREAFRAKIHAALVPELERRWRLTLRALRVLEADARKDNPQLAPVVDLALDECRYQYWNPEQSRLRELSPGDGARNLGSHPETDFAPERAARRYFMHLHAHELTASELIHGDALALERALDAGNGFDGTVTAVTREGVNHAGAVRWTVETSSDESLRLREDSHVCLVGARKRHGTLARVTTDGPRRTIVVELRDGLTKRAEPRVPNADDQAWVGRAVRFLDRTVVGLSIKKSIDVTSADGPGAWLTHAAPLPEPSPAAQIRPDLVDFVKTLQSPPER